MTAFCFKFFSWLWKCKIYHNRFVLPKFRTKVYCHVFLHHWVKRCVWIIRPKQQPLGAHLHPVAIATASRCQGNGAVTWRATPTGESLILCQQCHVTVTSSNPAAALPRVKTCQTAAQWATGSYKQHIENGEEYARKKNLSKSGQSFCTNIPLYDALTARVWTVQNQLWGSEILPNINVRKQWVYIQKSNLTNSMY